MLRSPVALLRMIHDEFAVDCELLSPAPPSPPQTRKVELALPMLAPTELERSNIPDSACFITTARPARSRAGKFQFWSIICADTAVGTRTPNVASAAATARPPAAWRRS